MADRILSWSGGKDAATVLYEMQRKGTPVGELLTTVTGEYDRSSMHGVRRSLYQRQAEALAIPITFVELPNEPSNEEYEAIMESVMERYVERGVTEILFGDLHLEDVRSYREDRLSSIPIAGGWPIWGRDSTEHMRRFIEAGFKATVVSVHGDSLDASFLGTTVDDEFLESLPTEVDPAGEGGEFHTFVWDGPIFERPVQFAIGEIVTRSVGSATMHYCDLIDSDNITDNSGRYQ